MSGVIQDARVLQDEFIPKEVAHRDGEMDALTHALGPVTRDEPAEPAVLFGPSGAGKTCLAQFAVDRLRESVFDLAHQYVNCWRDYTRFRALHRIAEGIGSTGDIHRGSATTDSLLERLEAYDGPQAVVILDEVDQLQDGSVIYDLYRMRGISMILIANREEELYAQLDDRLVSRLRGSVQVTFEKYDLEELVAILEDRVRWGLRADAIDREQLVAIADAAAGDARVAISILRNAARRADQAGATEIDTEVLEASVPEAKDELRRKHVDQLQPHQRTLYQIIQDGESVAPADLYEAYRERVEDPKSDRTVRNHLSKLAHYNLIEKVGESVERTYHVPE